MNRGLPHTPTAWKERLHAWRGEAAKASATAARARGITTLKADNEAAKLASRPPGSNPRSAGAERLAGEIIASAKLARRE